MANSAHSTTALAFPLAPPDRTHLENEIERLIGLLDAIDGDTDNEPADDELDAAYPEGRPHLGFTKVGEDDEDGGDCEPSLGWTGHHGNQAYIATERTGGPDDCEAVNEDGDPDQDGDDGSYIFGGGSGRL